MTYVGDSTADSLCSSEDLLPLLGASVAQSQSGLQSQPHDLHYHQFDVKGSAPSSSAAAQSGMSLPLLFSFAAITPHLSEKGSSSDEADGLLCFERAAVAGCKTTLSDCARQQLDAESDLLAILLEILKNKKAFRHFAACQLRQQRDRGRGRGGDGDCEITSSRGERKRCRERGLVSRLCLRLLLNDTDRGSRWNVSSTGSPGLCVLRAKLQVRTVQSVISNQSSAFDFRYHLICQHLTSLTRWSDFYPV